MNNGLYEHLEVFIAIAQARSLTGASIRSGIAQATISRQLAALEKQLGCKLFRRSTRAISLTEAGEIYLRQALHIVELMQAAQVSVQEGGARLRGQVRVACSNGFGRKLLIPALGKWQGLHPDVRIELILSDQLSQLIEEGLDVAFRTAPLGASRLVARDIGVSRRIAVATPAYLKRFGPVHEPADLQHHQCLLFTGMEPLGVWPFSSAKGSSSVHVDGRLSFSTVDALCDAVLADLGIAILPDWFWTRELLDGQVVQLLDGYSLPPQTIHAVTASRQPAGGKVSTFIGFVEQTLRDSNSHREHKT